MKSFFGPVAACVLLAVTAIARGVIPNSQTKGGGTHDRRKPAMDMSQGADRADAMLQQTLGAITPPLRWNHGPSIDSGCGNMLGRDTGTGSVHRRVITLTKVSAERRGSLIGIVERSWKTQGYKINGVNPSKTMPAVYATTPDNFHIALEVGATGQFSFSAVTPCLTETHSLPAPTTTPNTPQCDDVPFPARDDIHDDYWSALVRT